MGCLCARSSGVFFQGVPAEAYFENKLYKPLIETFELLNLSHEDGVKLFLAFADMDDDQSGEVSLAELYKAHKLRKTRFVDAVFTVLDTDESGELDFNEFLIGVWNYLTLDVKGVIHFAFSMYDLDNNGYLTVPECKSLLRMLYNSDKAEKKLKKYLEEADADHDGKFTVDEFAKLNKQHPELLKPALELQSKLQSVFLSKGTWQSLGKWRRKKYAPDETVESIVQTRERERRETTKQREERLKWEAENKDRLESEAKQREAEERKRIEDETYDTMPEVQKEEVRNKREVWRLRKVCDEKAEALRLHYGGAKARRTNGPGLDELVDKNDLLGHTELMSALHELSTALEKLVPQIHESYEYRLEKALEEARFGTVEEIDKFYKTKAGKQFVKGQVKDKKTSEVFYKPHEMTPAFVKQEYMQMKVQMAVNKVRKELTDQYEADTKEYSEMLEDLLLDYGIDDTEVDMVVWERKWSEDHQRFYFLSRSSPIKKWTVPLPGEEDPDYNHLKPMRKYGAVDDVYARRAYESKEALENPDSSGSSSDDGSSSVGRRSKVSRSSKKSKGSKSSGKDSKQRDDKKSRHKKKKRRSRTGSRDSRDRGTGSDVDGDGGGAAAAAGAGAGAGAGASAGAGADAGTGAAPSSEDEAEDTSGKARFLHKFKKGKSKRSGKVEPEVPPADRGDDPF